MERHRATGDARHVLGRGALRAALRLARTIAPDPHAEPVALLALAQLHSLRAELGTGEQAVRDAMTAVHLFEFMEGEPPDPEHTVVVDISGLTDTPEVDGEFEDELTAIWELSAETGDVDMLEQVVARLREATVNAPTDDPRSVERIAVLGVALGRLGVVTHDAAHADEGVALLEEANRLAPGNAVHLSRLSITLQRNVEVTGRSEHLERAVDLSDTAVLATADDAPLHPVLLGNLCAALWTRGRYANHAPSLERAIALLPQVLDHPHLDPSTRGGHLTNLGNALRDLGQLTGDTAALSEAIVIHEQALAELDNAPGPQVSPTGLRMNFADTLATWHRFTHNPDALTDSIALFRRCLDDLGPDHPMRPMVLCDLGNALNQGPPGRPRADSEAVRAMREALGLLRPGHPVFPRVQSNLVVALLPEDPSEGSIPPNVLDEAVKLAESAVRLTAPVDPELGHRLNHLGRAHEARYRQAGAPADLAAATAAFQASARHESAPAWVQWRSYQAWGNLAADVADWAGAWEGFAGLAGLIPLSVDELTARRNRELHLVQLGSAIRDGAACALHLGRIDDAVRLLEEGRGVLLRHLVEHRTALDDLRALAPDLAPDYQRLREILQGVPGAGGRLDGAPGQALMRQRAARVLADLTDEIRLRPGLHDFPRRTPLDPDTVAADGPVVLLNVSRYRSDALVLTEAGPEVIPLASLTPDAVRAQVSALYDALAGRAAARDDEEARRAIESEVSGVLGRLWDDVVGPVLGRLALDHAAVPGERPPVWWCPTGDLTLLPLHAAERPPTAKGGPLCALDCVVSSYTPTLHALLRPDTAQTSAHPVGVAMPHTEGYADLESAEAEVRRIARLGDARLLVGERATRAAVLDALATATHVHFACHAVCHPQDPSRSGLIMADGPLTLGELSDLALGRGELVYLSACETARGGEVLTDEVLHLCATLRLAGFEHAVGTLWTIGDRIAAYTTAEFYAALGKERDAGRPASPAVVLNEVSSRLRDAAPDRPTRWATLIHVGG
ncbi:CHAT domain-containing protein [Streptomyces sp. R21]|uniref:CHAT domain-containing protein n=1 Tax=Streptomyces sp. R21 TaxID=3238627 RepID=A0AB39PMT3_9ACTN